MNSQDRLIQYFRNIHFSFSRLYAAFLTEMDLTLPQYALLHLLVEHDQIPMREAGQHLHITKSAVTYLADQLEKKKLVQRTAHAKDRRFYLLKILPQGKKIVARAQGIALRFFLKSLKSFSEDQKSLIADFYKAISGHLESFFKYNKKTYAKSK